MNTYRPLPSSVTVGASEIEGLGLIATENIPAGTNLGNGWCEFVHESDQVVMSTMLRSPLGGFVNHSETPNCERVKSGSLAGSRVKAWDLITLKDISAGQELTLKYSFYDPTRTADYPVSIVGEDIGEPPPEGFDVDLLEVHPEEVARGKEWAEINRNHQQKAQARRRAIGRRRFIAGRWASE